MSPRRDLIMSLVFMLAAAGGMLWYSRTITAAVPTAARPAPSDRPQFNAALFADTDFQSRAIPAGTPVTPGATGRENPFYIPPAAAVLADDASATSTPAAP